MGPQGYVSPKIFLNSINVLRCIQLWLSISKQSHLTNWKSEIINLEKRPPDKFEVKFEARKYLPPKQKSSNKFLMIPHDRTTYFWPPQNFRPATLMDSLFVGVMFAQNIRFLMLVFLGASSLPASQSLERSSSEDSGLAASPHLDSMLLREAPVTVEKIQGG